MNKEEKLKKRIISLENLLKTKYPKIFYEQKHLDDGHERIYWHYGYLMALKDITRNFLLSELSIN